MARQTVKRPARRDSVTVGHLIEHVKAIEEQCRILRMLLQRLDRKTEIKLTAQLKRAFAAKVSLPPGLSC